MFIVSPLPMCQKASSIKQEGDVSVSYGQVKIEGEYLSHELENPSKAKKKRGEWGLKNIHLFG